MCDRGLKATVEKKQWLFESLFGGTNPTRQARFGEVWWVRDSAWGRLEPLRHLNDDAKLHRGLCIRPQARMMAFGTSKIAQAKKSKSRVFEVPAGAYDGGDCPSAFLLDYALPALWQDCKLNHEPALLREDLIEKLRLKLEKRGKQ